MVSSVASQPMPACDVSVMYGPRCPTLGRDRKSTRLNSSHLGISYAVFCLKKKKKKMSIICLAFIDGAYLYTFSIVFYSMAIHSNSIIHCAQRKHVPSMKSSNNTH